MSSASKSKSKDKSTPRTGKEQSKVSIKPAPMHAYGGNGSSTSVYNPVLGTFHTLEISPPPLAPQSNSRFRTIDDPEDHSGNSPGTTAEYDSLSNNDSCSGESEDQKEKPTSTAPRIDAIPGCDNNDKRDKIRQKNERKHQRQRERRAQELHERCNAFLTSRKLETLSHQLVVMGFPSDRAIMALIVNEGRMEDSVSWLLHEGVEDNRQHVLVNLEDKSHIKLDITDELARVAELEVKLKCTKQDVERAVVACEGDLLRAEDSLRSQKQAATAVATPKSDEYVDSTGLNNKIAGPNHNNAVLIRAPIKGPTSATIQQQRRDEKDLNYSKTMLPGTLPQEFANRSLQQAFKKMQLKPTDWSRVQPTAIDKRWLAMSSAPSVSYPSLASPVQISGPSLKSESQFVATMGHEAQTGLQAGALKEPSFIVMRRPKQQNLSSSIDLSVSPPAASGWYPSGSPALDILTAANGGVGHNLSSMGSTGSSLQQFYPQNNFHPMLSGPADLPAATGWSNQSWNASGTTSSSLEIPSSLGLFTSWGSSGSSASSSQNDWNTSGLTAHRDYTSIDWSLDLSSRSPLRNDMQSDSWSTMFMGGNATARPHMNVGGGIYLPGLQEGSGLLADSSGPSNSHEWSNPFEGSDLFRVTRQYVTSPTL
ncbi:hypothetical protein IEQ34_005672 [Dendrobium chrysotoxum]|uniref:UBA domain-containing protein n=1 Tax=Dendrobium chrysotoxum TaxID=161865 RepID=A0AAV7GVM9_DENCH|nr:hypothetical protein IEQ34_005672 [Dendrobium chrysotoxum]